MYPEDQTHMSRPGFLKPMSKQDVALLRKHTCCMANGCDNRTNSIVVRRNRRPVVFCAFCAEKTAPLAKPPRRKRLTRAPEAEPAPSPPTPAPQPGPILVAPYGFRTQLTPDLNAVMTAEPYCHRPGCGASFNLVVAERDGQLTVLCRYCRDRPEEQL
jgi:hypothetical protein